jgi:hypothetical protein
MYRLPTNGTSAALDAALRVGKPVTDTYRHGPASPCLSVLVGKYVTDTFKRSSIDRNALVGMSVGFKGEGRAQAWGDGPMHSENFKR